MQVITNAIGAEVKINRLRAGLSQKDLADLVGVDIKTVGRVERGDSGVTQKTLYLIAFALNLTPSELTEAANAALRREVEASTLGVDVEEAGAV